MEEGKKFDLSGVQPSGERLSFSHRTRLGISSRRFHPLPPKNKNIASIRRYWTIKSATPPAGPRAALKRCTIVLKLKSAQL